jgi:hypothetical protein
MERPFLLLAAGRFGMLLVDNGRGLLEILGLPQGKLP